MAKAVITINILLHSDIPPVTKPNFLSKMPDFD
jgi:hypothetical protein